MERSRQDGAAGDQGEAAAGWRQEEEGWTQQEGVMGEGVAHTRGGKTWYGRAREVVPAQVTEVRPRAYRSQPSSSRKLQARVDERDGWALLDGPIWYPAASAVFCPSGSLAFASCLDGRRRRRTLSPLWDIAGKLHRCFMILCCTDEQQFAPMLSRNSQSGSGSDSDSAVIDISESDEERRS